MANTISIGIELEGKDALKTIKGLEKGFSTLGKTGTKSVKSIDSAMSVLQGTLGAQAVIKGLQLTSQALQAGAKDALEFGKAVQEINSIVPRTAVETLALKQNLLALSSEFGDKAQNQAKAFYNILSAGTTDTAQALTVLTAANKAAVAGLTDVDTAANGLLSVVNSYGADVISAAQASDILFNTVREGRTTFPELASNIGRVASIAASAKVKFEEIGGALAFVTKSGVKTDEAVVGLRALLTNVIGPTEGVAKAAKAMGIEFNATALRTKGLGGFMEDLAKKTGGNVEKLRELFPNVRAFNVAVKIAGGDLDDFNRILGETGNATGATDKALKTITDSAAFQFDKLTNQLRNFPTAVLTNFEEPLADALKAINNFVSTQGVLLLVDAIDGIINAYQGMNSAASEVQQFFNFLAEGALNTGKAWNEFVLSANRARQALNELTGDDETLKMLKAEEAQLQRNIDVLDQAVLANQQATLKLQAEEEKKFSVAEEFRQKLAAGRKQQVADQQKVNEEIAANDKAAAEKKLAAALEGETAQFEAIKELKAAQAAEVAEAEEQAKLEKLLRNEEEFQFLADNLGKEAALKELARIKDIDNEAKRLVELKKLRDKARKEEEAGILSFRKFEDLTNREKIAAQKSTLSAIAGLSQSNNSTLFAIGKASSLALAGINVAEGVTKALSAFPPPFNFAAAAVGAAGAINIAKIASAKKPSAGSFQSGGIIEGPSQTGDNLTANVNAGEAIFNKRQQKNLFNAVDSGNLGGGGNNITLNNPLFLSEDSVDNVIDEINNRVEFGNKTLRAS